jgi:phage terminase large subunit GpA-like protein
MNVEFKSDWRNIVVKCPHCGATQKEMVVVNVSSFKGITCFYCKKH